ncbi:MAG: MBL fold metallo-hydrolase [Parasporobacterium sp.]|nr:MBL fold metallo-hydrolase [Parasporobacterium sp.]
MLDNITVFTQSSIRIKSSTGTIYLDPLEIPEEYHDADYILITHNHGDHFSPKDIEKVARVESVLIVPEKMEKQARELQADIDHVETVIPGKHYQVKDLKFETVAAYNNLKPFHPKKSGWVGYLLYVDASRIYVAGDTDVTKENKAVKCDIAMVPIGGTFTMDAAKAAELVNCIEPEIAIPTHYGTIVGKYSDAEIFAAKVKETVRIELKLKQ